MCVLMKTKVLQGLRTITIKGYLKYRRFGLTTYWECTSCHFTYIWAERLHNCVMCALVPAMRYRIVRSYLLIYCIAVCFLSQPLIKSSNAKSAIFILLCNGRGICYQLNFIFSLYYVNRFLYNGHGQPTLYYSYSFGNVRALHFRIF